MATFFSVVLFSARKEVLYKRNGSFCRVAVCLIGARNRESD